MYRISPPAVFAHKSVMDNPVYRARVERVAAALVTPRPVETYTDDQLPALIRDRKLLERRVPMGTLGEVNDPILLFNTFRFSDEESARALGKRLADQGLPAGPDLLGLEAFDWSNYNLESDPNRAYKVCRPCWRIHLQRGCLHRCAYCGLGGLLVSMMNVDEYCRHLKKIIELHPWQKTYLLDDDADPPCLEPELGCLGELIEFFGTLDRRYLIIHTKTWNTDWLRGLKHNGNTIIVWSLSGPTQSRYIEPNAGTTEERIEAARVAEEAGYQIRYKFKPIVPVSNWRQDAAASVDMIFKKTHPDIISLCCLMWMDVDEMKKRLAPVIDLLDPEFLRAAEEHRGQAENPLTRPFPDKVRAEIYSHHLAEIRKHDTSIPVSLSTESWQMWNDFAAKLGMTATNYVCGCGPLAVPGATKLDCHPFTTAVRHDGGKIPGVVPPFKADVA
jgi:hypothetical protein